MGSRSTGKGLGAERRRPRRAHTVILFRRASKTGELICGLQAGQQLSCVREVSDCQGMRGGFRDAEDALCLGRGTSMLPDESSLRNDLNASSLTVFLYSHLQ